jgi:hypothetical protein
MFGNESARAETINTAHPLALPHHAAAGQPGSVVAVEVV